MLNIKPYVVGKFYRVPVVRGVWDGRLGDWPVLGPWHEDREYIGFPEEHYHLDARFLNARQWRWAEISGGLRKVSPVFSAVVHEGVADMDGETHPVKYIGLKRRKCGRAWPEYPGMRAPWMAELELAYASAELGPALVCPHKGAPLQGLEVKAGCVHCPLHGLKWSVETGKLVRQFPQSEESKT